MAATYRKVPFEWTAPTAPPDDPLADGLSWATGNELPAPIGLVSDVFASSPAPEDRRSVGTFGSEEAARRTLQLAPGFSYLSDRWHVLVADGQPAGFVLPVIYNGCSRDGLDEATIYHMGVAPAHRGTGLGRLLLRRATRVLVEHGVWRIFCDTPADNAPMIHLFENEGWSRLPEYSRPV